MKLYVVGTPIGNLGDISARALEVLSSVGAVFAEDTRVTGKLLAHYEISVPLQRFDENSSLGDIARLLGILEMQGSAALTTDAGTPGLSDPAFRLIAEARMKFGAALEVIAVPGPSALAAAISIAHFPVQPFTFYGFPPHKKGREKFFDTVALVEHAVVFYESVHRMENCLESLVKRVPDCECLVARELTKMHEEVWRGTVAEVAAQAKTGVMKGEFTVILAPKTYSTIRTN